ncbi:MAG: zinc D-Ala-D-Ala dipeptidase [Chthoniobacter sp.]|jgi:D-alanyl-D-alanine dipeptidase|nr:zinc D-Ala-D-Ala dipeptidase [Chthoniobacter sp.]
MRLRSSAHLLLCLAAAVCFLPCADGICAERPLDREPLVDLHAVDPTIVIDLRYATPHNVTGRPLYPPGTPCLVRAGVAQRLRAAQYVLRRQGLGLKVWDAYRPLAAQRRLFDAVKMSEFVADPASGGALHSWGVAVDATLVDAHGRDVPMPTDFDDFSKTASMHYAGGDRRVWKNLATLQHAMSPGFYGMHGEWWHFIAKNWKCYGPAIPAGASRKK